ncbi:MAG: vitamin B12-dependent ribonucleotide reductase, partial [Planctomycetaceae bacterium]|nr:vitamin B12-dependent ribonucleotide reductase [Planctomycetaceae bacterium]
MPAYPSNADSRRRKGRRRAAGKLRFTRTFSQADVHPFDALRWDLRTAAITSESGKVIFEQKDVEVPSSWSQLATNVVVSKYFRGAVGQENRERSVKQLVGRVVDTITGWARDYGYFETEEDLKAFSDDLCHLLVNQYLAFNSPVWFNVGIEKKPQCSACFINSVDDTLESILELAKTEGKLFKYGSGAGSNLSKLRSSREMLSTGGKPSGPVSFMRGYDAFANVIKSGGKTRRAAKMQILDCDHPDVEEFIWCKSREEKKAHALIDAGYDGAVNGEAYQSVFFQNSNLSVRVTDEFMQAVENDALWHFTARTSGQPLGEIRARDLFKQICEAAWHCGDPGLQYDDTINRWHTCKATDRIYASNPCSEYVFLDDTACNLASLNLMKFRREDGSFDVPSFRAACRVSIIAQEVLVDAASYPTPRIGEMSHRYRTLGLGYANLGALLMAHGVPYDSDEGRAYAGAVTAIMTGEAYRASAEVAAAMGPFPGYADNAEAMLGVIAMHRDAAWGLAQAAAPADLVDAARSVWDEALDLGRESGYRNAQVTVLAPTGTIAFMMDCDTTGVEPDIALVKYKKLVGGGVLKIVNRTVPLALEQLGYAPAQIAEIIEHIDRTETIEGAPGLRDEHLAVFDCAFRARNGVRSIVAEGHVRMMAAAQPFLSGAISKTVNLPPDATVEEIGRIYMEGWKLGLKAVAIYRDGCKRIQPLSTSRDEKATSQKKVEAKAPAPAPAAPAAPAKPARRRLPDERHAITHKFSIGGHDGYVTIGEYDDGAPGEIFVVMAKEGSTVSGLMDTVATLTSIALQYGVPADVLVNKFSHTRFEPSGMTTHPDIRFAKSPVDYIFRYLGIKYISSKQPVEREVGEAAP